MKKLLFIFFSFVFLTVSGQNNGSLEYSSSSSDKGVRLLFNADPNYPKMGHVMNTLDIPLTVEGILQNVDSLTLTNLIFKTRVFDDNFNLEDSASSPVIDSVSPGNHILLLTDSLKLWEADCSDIDLHFTFTTYYQKNGVPSFLTYKDTITLIASKHQVSHDFGILSDTFDIAQIGNDGSAMAILLHLEDVEGVEGVSIYLDSATHPGAELLFELYKQADFDTATGPTATPVMSEYVYVSDNIPNPRYPNSPLKYFKLGRTGWCSSHFEHSGSDHPLRENSYFLVVQFFNWGNTSPIIIGMDGTQLQNSLNSLYYNAYASNGWLPNAFTPIVRLDVMPITEIVVGLNEQSEIGFEIYPNPASSNITIHREEPNASEESSISIRDIQGRMLLEQDHFIAGTSINISRLPKGIYILEVHRQQRLTGKQKLVIR